MAIGVGDYYSKVSRYELTKAFLPRKKHSVPLELK